MLRDTCRHYIVLAQLHTHTNLGYMVVFRGLRIKNTTKCYAAHLKSKHPKIFMVKSLHTRIQTGNLVCTVIAVHSLRMTSECKHRHCYIAIYVYIYYENDVRVQTPS